MFLDTTFKKKFFQRALKNAAVTSSQDIISAFAQFINNPKPQEMMVLMRSLTTSGVWVSHSTLRYFASIIERDKYLNNQIPDQISIEIIRAIRDKQPLPEGISHEIAFDILFRDISFAHRNSLYDGMVPLPKIAPTLVLISGVLNEIFSTPAFARGAEYISQKSGLKRTSFQVSGRKGTEHNIELLHKQFEIYLTSHPNEKLWIVAFSKGGLDILHFMHKYPEFSDKHIAGVSLMATPIMGSGYLQNRLFKTAREVESRIFKGRLNKFSKDRDLFAISLREALSEEKQANWFHLFHHELPKKPFYSALAFESHWYQSHIWMMMTKLILQAKGSNDGVVEVDRAQFPSYFQGINFGVQNGHHLVGTRSSFFSQEALLEAHLIYLNYLGHLN
jgi:hypothetical protein